MNKFKIELTWHSCTDCLPEEDYNKCLYVTDGKDIELMRWRRTPGWQRFENLTWYIESGVNSDGYWWADIEQTVQGCDEFK